MLRTLILLLALPISTSAIAAEVTSAEVQRAQHQMLDRVSSAAQLYAEKIHLDPAYVTYCQTELNLKIHQNPIDGSVPFGVNYKQITDPDQMNAILGVREKFERSFFVLCLANAKNALRDAERK